MENAETEGYQLKRNAEKRLQEAMRHFRDLIVREAGQLAAGRPIGPDDVDSAYQRLGFPDRDLEGAQTTITRTLRENRAIEWVAYGMAFALFAMGIAAICFGMIGSQDTSLRITSIVGGAVLETLLLMPLRMAINCRRHNIAIRMLGILIDRVDDPKKLTSLLHDTFQMVVVGDMPSASR